MKNLNRKILAFFGLLSLTSCGVYSIPDIHAGFAGKYAVRDEPGETRTGITPTISASILRKEIRGKSFEGQVGIGANLIYGAVNVVIIPIIDATVGIGYGYDVSSDRETITLNATMIKF